MTLKAALAKLEANDVSSAVPLLLGAWRRQPDPRIAEVLDGVSSRIQRPALPDGSQKKTSEAFVDLVARKDPLDLPRLVAVIGTTRSGLMVAQLEAMLEHWPADPRVTRPFLALLKNPPFTGSSTQSAWRRLFKLLQQYADPRVITELAALDFAMILKEQNQFRTGGIDENAYAAAFFSDRASAVIAALKKKYAKGLPAAPPADDATLSRLLELVRPRAETELLSAVQSAPAEEGARAVLADHLLERDDVRGHFMALQQVRAQGKVSPAQAKEEQALLAQHGLQWTGALGPLLDKQRLEFERGFLSSCVIHSDRIGLVGELTGNPGWSTVRHVHLEGAHFPHALLVHPVMKSLTSVTGIRDAAARTLLAGPDTFPWTAVELDLPHYDTVPQDSKLLEKNVTRVFPSLRELTLDGYSNSPNQFGWLWTLKFAHLEKIGISGASARDIPAWLNAMSRGPKSAVLELSFHFKRGHEFRLLPDANGKRTVLEVASRARASFHRTTLEELAKAAASLTGQLTRVRILTRSTKAERAAFEALLAPGGTLEV